jgi:hypothetical protein
MDFMLLAWRWPYWFEICCLNTVYTIYTSHVWLQLIPSYDCNQSNEVIKTFKDPNNDSATCSHNLSTSSFPAFSSTQSGQPWLKVAIYTISHIAQAKVFNTTARYRTWTSVHCVQLSSLGAYSSKILISSFQLHLYLPVTQSSRIPYAFLPTAILATCPAHHILLDFSP